MRLSREQYCDGESIYHSGFTRSRPATQPYSKRSSDPRYIEGQRLLVEAMKYLAQQDPEQNKDAVLLLSEHFCTRFRMTDRPEYVPASPIQPFAFNYLDLKIIRKSGFPLR